MMPNRPSELTQYEPRLNVCFDNIEARKARSNAPPEADNRLSIAASAIVIGGLSAICWAVVICIATAVRTVL